MSLQATAIDVYFPCNLIFSHKRTITVRIYTYIFLAEYRDEVGKPWVFPAVKLAEKEIHDEEPIIADYLFPKFFEFSKLSAKLILGENSSAIKEDRVSCVNPNTKNVCFF